MAGILVAKINYNQISNIFRLCNRIEPLRPCFMGSRHCTCAYTAIGDPARRPGIPQAWYWHGTIWQGSVRFNLMEEVSPPSLFLSCCTYSMIGCHQYPLQIRPYELRTHKYSYNLRKMMLVRVPMNYLK